MKVTIAAFLFAEGNVKVDQRLTLRLSPDSYRERLSDDSYPKRLCWFKGKILYLKLTDHVNKSFF